MNLIKNFIDKKNLFKIKIFGAKSHLRSQSETQVHA